MSVGVSITVDKPSCLVDEGFAITVSGLHPHNLVTVVATLTERYSYYSRAVYRANEHGIVDVSKIPSLSGTYTGKNLSHFAQHVIFSILSYVLRLSDQTLSLWG